MLRYPGSRMERIQDLFRALEDMDICLQHGFC